MRFLTWMRATRSLNFGSMLPVRVMLPFVAMASLVITCGARG